MGTGAAKSSDVADDGHHNDSRPIHVDPVIIRALALVVPCGLYVDGLCSRCWTVARAVEQLTVAARRDQAADIPVLGVAA